MPAMQILGIEKQQESMRAISGPADRMKEYQQGLAHLDVQLFWTPDG